MPNPYDANFEVGNGDVRLSGVIDFTDSTNQPGGSQTLLTLPFSLTAAEIKASMLTPHTIIPAQGANTLIVPTVYTWRFSAGGTPYTGAEIDLVYGSAGDLNVIASFLTGGDFSGWSLSTFSSGYAEGGDPADYLNQPVKIAANLRGSIATSHQGAGGSGYAVGDTGTIDFGSPLATYRIDAVSGGAVTAFTITNPGGDYSLATGRAGTTWTTTPGGSQPGGGSGFEVIVDAIDASGSAGDGTLEGIVYYVVADLT